MCGNLLTPVLAIKFNSFKILKLKVSLLISNYQLYNFDFEMFILGGLELSKAK